MGPHGGGGRRGLVGVETIESTSIALVAGRSGFLGAIRADPFETEAHLCIVRVARNPMRSVAGRDRRGVAVSLKNSRDTNTEVVLPDAPTESRATGDDELPMIGRSQLRRRFGPGTPPRIKSGWRW